MTCRRAFEIDLPAFLATPRDAAWDDFRAHYPTCAACAAEVAAWTALESRLGGAAHPEPALLLRWAEAPDALDLDTRRRLAGHLDGCRACAEELRALARFDAATPAPDAAVDPAGPSAPRRRRSALRSVGRVLWHPAFAWAAVLVLAVTTLVEQHDRVAVGTAPVPAGRSEVARPSPAPPPAAPMRDATPPRGFAGTGAARDDEAPAAAAGPGAKATGEAPQPPPPAPEPEPEKKAERPGSERLGRTRRDAGTPAPADQLREGRAADEAAPAPAPPAAAMAQRAAPGAASARPLTVAVQPGTPTSALYMTLPQDARGGGEFELRIVASAGERELRQRLRIGSNARIAAMSVPSTWLVGGRYVVTLWQGDRELGRATLDVP